MADSRLWGAEFLCIRCPVGSEMRLSRASRVGRHRFLLMRSAIFPRIPKLDFRTFKRPLQPTFRGSGIGLWLILLFFTVEANNFWR